MKYTIAQKWDRRKEKFRSSWDKILFNLFLRPETSALRERILAEAEAALSQSSDHESDQVCLASPDPVVRQGWQLKQAVEGRFRNLYRERTKERVLIHVPNADYSPAGYSLFTNLAESLTFLGVPTRILSWDGRTASLLKEFRPTVLLTSDHESYLERIDWRAVASAKAAHGLRVGLTASLQEYGSAPLLPRIAWGKQHAIDFYYTFRDETYVKGRVEYSPFFEAGFPMVHLPFGANILHYYPVAGFERDLDFAIMATRKSEHMTYLKGIVGHHVGFIDGPGWRHVHHFRFNRERDRYIYARARIGLNVHLPEQLHWACEVNERTYQLAACGVPQLVDHPLLIDKLFSKNATYVADSPAAYAQLFRYALAHPEEAVERALLAQREVFAGHTTFHRAEGFLAQLQNV